jgi:2-dehydro-3-deoxyphosphogluconate aldolase / (4S)-4-hydroxy-2-oxoglutarate aldolase
MNIIDILQTDRILPVVSLQREEEAVPVGDALVAGGLHSIEIVLRTPAALKAIELAARGSSGLCVGAGTILNVDQARRAVDAGASFLVSPGFSAAVVDFAGAHGIPFIPGVVTPTEIMAALDLGVRVMKFFPAESSGGVPYVQAISGPFHQVKFVPTGGIDERNLQFYLRIPTVLACGGSWMVHPDLIKAGRFDEITRLTCQAASVAKGLRPQDGQDVPQNAVPRSSFPVQN